MKLASFHYNGEDRIGIAKNDSEIIDIRVALGTDAAIPDNMIDLIAMGEAGLALAAKALDTTNKKAVIPTDDITWQPPVRKPGKICSVAMNNSASNARKISAPQHPAFFLKPSSCLVGHKQPLRIRSYYGSVHPEPELAVIIGRSTRDVDAADALNYVCGYSVFNDVTGNGMRAEDRFHYWALYPSEDDANQLERREQHLSYAGRYKGCDTFGALGPWLVTRDEIENPDDLAVSCKVGGETVAEDSTRYYNYKVAEILSFISQFHTLNAGDVVSCGTAFKPSAHGRSIHHINFQVAGGPVEVTIEGLGTQENPVIVEEREMGRWRLS